AGAARPGGTARAQRAVDRRARAQPGEVGAAAALEAADARPGTAASTGRGPARRATATRAAAAGRRADAAGRRAAVVRWADVDAVCTDDDAARGGSRPEPPDGTAAAAAAGAAVRGCERCAVVGQPDGAASGSRGVLGRERTDVSALGARSADPRADVGAATAASAQPVRRTR